MISRKEASVDEHIRSLLNHSSTEMMDWDGLFIISSDTVIKLNEANSKFITNERADVSQVT